VKTKTSPRGLGAVRLATRGGLTSCTQQRLQARTPSKQRRNKLRFHLNAPLIKANKLTEENPAKSKPSPGSPRAVRPPPRRLDRLTQKTWPRVNPQLPIAPISRITPQIAAKLRGWLGYLLGKLFLKGIDPKRSQSKGITDLGPLCQELEQLEKPPNRDRFKEVLGARSPAKETQGPHM
jgi:hypothetical protein